MALSRVWGFHDEAAYDTKSGMRSFFGSVDGVLRSGLQAPGFKCKTESDSNLSRDVPWRCKTYIQASMISTLLSAAALRLPMDRNEGLWH